MKPGHVIVKSLVVAVAFASVATAQLAIDWHTIDGGGFMNSTGGGFSLSGTIGQADALPNGPMVGGGFELTGGFWAAAEVCHCPGDVNHDGRRDGADVQQFVHCVMTGGNCSCADVDGAGGINADDASAFVADLLAGSSCN